MEHRDDLEEFDGPRPIRREELAASRRLAVLCFPDTAWDEDQSTLYASPRRGGLQVICRQGVPVSQIGIYHSRVNIYGSHLRIASIGGVCTHPDYRGRGLSTRLLDHCLRQLTAEGARLVLISGTRGLYARAGCVTAQDFKYFTLRPGDLSRGRPCLAPTREVDGLRIRQATDADASLCARLYQTEPVRFVRRVEAFTEHFRQREEFPKAEDWIVEAEGRPVAYLFLGIPWEYWHGRATGVREVFEYAGSRVALIGALARVMARLELRELRLSVPWQDVDFLQLLREQGVQGDPIPLIGHTMRIVNFPGLMRDLRPYMRARLEAGLRRGLRFEQRGPVPGKAGEDRYAIVRGQERLELDGATMTRLVMGMPEELAPDVPIAPDALSAGLSALFPLPSFLPGLNFR